MKISRLLYLCAHQLTAYRWQSGELSSEGVFAANEDGHQQFADYLQGHTRSVFALLANVSEEGFNVETIPFLRGADRQAIIARKLGQLYFNTALTTSLSLGYEKNKRKDERLLLAALTNKASFAPWLDAIARRHIALSGIYSLPLLAPSLLRKLALDDEPCLLLSVQDQSIRQSYFENGEVLFSRLTPLHSSSISGIAQTFASEAQKLQQYLASQRMIGRQQSITAHLLAHADAHKAIGQSCVDTATIHFNILDIADCARRTGLKAVPAETHCESLFLNLLVIAPPRVQFADDGARHDYHLGKIASALYGVAAVTLAGCLLFGGKLLLEARTLGAQAQALRAEAALDRHRYQEIVKTFPRIPTDNETLRRVIDRYVALERQSSTPAPLYRAISRALAAAPAIELDALDWQVGEREAGAAGQNAATPAQPSVAGDHEALIVNGTLRLGARPSAREILAAFNAFVDALKANPELQLNVLQRPFDVESAKSLKSGDSLLEDERPRAFSVRVTRRTGA